MKRVKLKIGVGLVCCLMGMGLAAQDARFSQFYTAPSHTNPALTGIFPGQFRAIVNYRNQWSSILGNTAFNTIGASFDYRINTTKYDYLSVGANLLRDNVGDAQFSQTKANLSLSYLKKLAGSRYSRNSHYLSVGFQGGIGQNGLDWSRLSFSEQFNDEDELFVPTAPTGENFGRNSRVYADANAGVAYYAVLDEDLSVYGGLSIHHLTQPNVSFYDNSTEILYVKFVMQAGAQIPFNEYLSILPAAIFSRQGLSSETVLGANIRYSNGDFNELGLRIGLWPRLVGDESKAIVFESIILASMLELERFVVGISYDITTSSLQEANNSRGAFELSLSYYTEEQSRYRTVCPRF